MRNLKDTKLIILFLLTVTLSCSKGDDIISPEEDLSAIKESFKNTISLYGEDLKINTENRSLKSDELYEKSIISYTQENYGENGIKKLNEVINEINNIETDITNYSARIEKLEDINFDISNGSGIMQEIFSNDIIYKRKITSSRNLNDEILSRLEKTSIDFYEKTLSIQKYNRDEYKKSMLETYDKIIEDIELDGSISFDEKESLIFSIQLNKENIDNLIPKDIFENYSSKSLHARGWFKSFIKFIAKVVVAVVISVAIVAVTLVAGVATGIIGAGGQNTSQQLVGVVLASGALILNDRLYKKSFKWIDRW